jgi:hypothetical protein
MRFRTSEMQNRKSVELGNIGCKLTYVLASSAKVDERTSDGEDRSRRGGLRFDRRVDVQHIEKVADHERPS